MEEYRPVVNTLPEVTQLLLGQERHCQGLLDVLQPDQTQGPQVVSVCGAPGAGTHLCPKTAGHAEPVMLRVFCRVKSDTHPQTPKLQSTSYYNHNSLTFAVLALGVCQ